MAAATSDAYNLPNLETFTPSYPPAASTLIYANLPVCVDANGNLNAAADTSGLIFVGYSQQNVNNSGGTANGSAGTLFCKVTPKQALKFVEIGYASPVQWGSGTPVGKLVYFTDNQTVASSGTTNSILCGKCIAVTSTAASGRVIVDVLDRTAG